MIPSCLSPYALGIFLSFIGINIFILVLLFGFICFLLMRILFRITNDWLLGAIILIFVTIIGLVLLWSSL